jgi:putative ABC transport system substrate-binding protein
MSEMKRREVITLLGGAAVAWPHRTVLAQLTHAIPKVGWLKIQGEQHTRDQLQAFLEGMQALGLIEGRDYLLEQRYADGDEARLPLLAAELINSGVSIIVATSQPSIAAAWHVTKTVPVIGRMVDDPVTDGMARSLARPGGNITGVYTMTEEMNPKRLALLKEAVCPCGVWVCCCATTSQLWELRRRIGKVLRRRLINSNLN